MIGGIVVTTHMGPADEHVRVGVWRPGAREKVCEALRDFAKAREANQPDAFELLTSGPEAIVAIESAIGAIARELYDFLKRNEEPAVGGGDVTDVGPKAS